MKQSFFLCSTPRANVRYYFWPPKGLRGMVARILLRLAFWLCPREGTEQWEKRWVEYTTGTG